MVTQIEIEEKNTAKYNIPMLEKSFELFEFLVNYPSGFPMQDYISSIKFVAKYGLSDKRY